MLGALLNQSHHGSFNIIAVKTGREQTSVLSPRGSVLLAAAAGWPKRSREYLTDTLSAKSQIHRWDWIMLKLSPAALLKFFSDEPFCLLHTMVMGRPWFKVPDRRGGCKKKCKDEALPTKRGHTGDPESDCLTAWNQAPLKVCTYTPNMLFYWIIHESNNMQNSSAETSTYAGLVDGCVWLFFIVSFDSAEMMLECLQG